MENRRGMRVLFALLVALAVLLGLVVLTTSIVSLILGATVYEDLSLTAVLVIVMPLLWTLLTVVGVELLVVREGDSRSDFKRATRTENGKADEEFVITGVESRDRDEVTGDSGLESRKEEMEDPKEDSTVSRYGRSVTEALLTNSHTFHLKRRLCQRLSKGAIILTLVGYWTIFSSLSTVKWTFFATLTKLDKTQAMYNTIKIILGVLCPVTMLIGCTLLGIVVMYATAGQVDGKVLISYLLPTVDLVSATTTSNLKRKTRYWKFAGVCIAIKNPRGNVTQLRHYLDTTPATWTLMLFIYFSVVVAFVFFVNFGLVVRVDGTMEPEECDRHNWHCYVVDIVQVLMPCIEAHNTSNIRVICYRLSTGSELDNIGVGVGGAVAVYLIATYLIPLLIQGVLMLEKVKKTKLWSVLIMVVGIAGFIISLTSMVFFPLSSNIIHALLFSLCMLPIGILVGCSKTRMIVVAPDVKPSFIVDMEYKKTHELQLQLEVNELRQMAEQCELA